MAVIGLSLLLATAVYLLVRSPPWLSAYLVSWRQPRIEGPPPDHDAAARSRGAGERGSTGQKQREKDRVAMPPPPPPPVIVPPRAIRLDEKDGGSDEEQTTPKVGPTPSSTNVPAISLEVPEPSSRPPRIFGHNSPQTLIPPPPRPAARPPRIFGPNSPQTLMPPPPSSLPPTPLRNLPVPLPSRGPITSSSSSSGLAPPPTHSTKPSKPSKKVVLAPGRSPLDWARISSSPSADLRNLPPSTPYLRVTRSQLKTMNGRKGKDAWMALSGRVYNISPYKEYHPGGVGELMRGAAKDGTKLFGEVHPWVNYETMLQSCLIGILVEDDDRPGGMENID